MLQLTTRQYYLSLSLFPFPFRVSLSSPSLTAPSLEITTYLAVRLDKNVNI